jgi:hypothetical protein
VFKNVLRKLALATAVIALAFATAAQSPAYAQRTIEEAANALLTEVLATLKIQIVNEELLLELSYEMQYALDTGIVDPDTVNELDIEVLDVDLPDEELFEEDEEIPAEEGTNTSTPDAAMTQLSDELKLKLQSRLALRVSAQVQYWELIAGEWSTASQLAAREFTTCLDAATTDEESDICYFNEQQQLQFFYAQQLGENYSARLNAADQLGPDVSALLSQSMTRSRLTVQEALQFMNAEELGTLGLTPNALEDISRKLENQAANSPSGGPTNSTPTSNNPSNGQNQ